ncbi:hypothetical protein ACFQAV_12860 [Companilactobacillus huachuanensis]|uniref:XRE family transcriptional regulator n=1 Tax=Companilactobacillus huachuanensis TaxID=2559914 RepID=A0ABW1RQL0_9LACO|nr:hypothetical protein [Companilactobacillus huachuanensis]
MLNQVKNAIKLVKEVDLSISQISKITGVSSASLNKIKEAEKPESIISSMKYSNVVAMSDLYMDKEKQYILEKYGKEYSSFGNWLAMWFHKSMQQQYETGENIGINNQESRIDTIECLEEIIISDKRLGVVLFKIYQGDKYSGFEEKAVIEKK